MKFYVLENPKVGPGDGDAVTDYLYVDGSKLGDAPQCPVCGKYLGGMPLLPPIRLELKAWGSRWGDVAFFGGDQILVSNRLRDLFVEAGLSGFTRFDPAELVKISRRKKRVGSPPNYQLASIQRGRALVDDAASGLERNEPSTCDECRSAGIRRTDRIVLEANTWSGEDVFHARGLPGTILASERFKRLCDDHDLANCCLVPAEDYHFDFYPHERPTPSSLH
jgi:ribosomal protein L34E